ncbi:MAG: hypothetical protein K6G63_00125 [Eubacterium sp.]|nr:hypothetical protein [Eubacterium sp.]
MEEEILSLLKESLEIEEVDSSLNPVNDYEMDSISLLTFLILVEEKYGVSFDDHADLSNHMDSVEEMVDYLVRVIREGDNE